MDWRDELAQQLPNSRLRRDYALAQVTTLSLGGPADALVDVADEAELVILFDFIRQRNLSWRLLGKGSNVLVPDEGVRGVVLRLGRGFSQVLRGSEMPKDSLLLPGDNGANDTMVWAGAGVSNPVFVRQCRNWGLGGMAFLTAVPGSIGGALAMNAGAHGAETSTFVRWARVLHLEKQQIMHLRREDMAFAYRQSPLKVSAGMLALGAVFQLQPMAQAEMEAAERAIQQYRRDTQPRDYPNCGSVFKNPPGHHAARLIQEAGLKGQRLGGMQVSEKHANFMVNRQDGTAKDMLALVALVRQTVQQRTGIALELEVEVWAP